MVGVVDTILAVVSYLINFTINGLTTVFSWMGLHFDASWKATLTIILAVIILAVLFDYCIMLFGRWLINSIVGLIAFLILHYLLNVNIPVTWFTVVVVAFFGVPGLLAIIVLHLGGLL